MNKPKFFVTPGYGEYMLNNLHYSQAVKIGDRVETSGQGGWDDNLQIPELLADEIAQAFRTVERTLATAGAGWEHVVHVNSYHVGGFPRRLTRDGQAISSLHAQPCPNLDRGRSCSSCTSKNAC